MDGDTKNIYLHKDKNRNTVERVKNCMTHDTWRQDNDTNYEATSAHCDASPAAVDSGCHGFDLDCVAKAGKEIIGDGARVAGG